MVLHTLKYSVCVSLMNDVFENYILRMFVDRGASYKTACLISRKSYHISSVLHPKAWLLFSNPIKTLHKLYGGELHKSMWVEPPPDSEYAEYFIQRDKRQRYSYIVLLHKYPLEIIRMIVEKEWNIVHGIYDFDFYWELIEEYIDVEFPTGRTPKYLVDDILLCPKFVITNDARNRISSRPKLKTYEGCGHLDIQRSVNLTMKHIHDNPLCAWDPRMFSFKNIKIEEIYNFIDRKWLINVVDRALIVDTMISYCAVSGCVPDCRMFDVLDDSQYLACVLSMITANQSISWGDIEKLCEKRKPVAPMIIIVNKYYGDRDDIPLTTLKKYVGNNPLIYQYGKYTWKDITQTEWIKYGSSICQNRTLGW